MDEKHKVWKILITTLKFEKKLSPYVVVTMQNRPICMGENFSLSKHYKFPSDSF